MNENEARTLIERFAEKQQGGHFACPRCGKMAMDAESVTRNALSRRATVHICDACGTVEALEDMTGDRRPLTAWAIVSAPENWRMRRHYSAAAWAREQYTDRWNDCPYFRDIVAYALLGLRLGGGVLVVIDGGESVGGNNGLVDISHGDNSFQISKRCPERMFRPGLLSGLLHAERLADVGQVVGAVDIADEVELVDLTHLLTQRWNCPPPRGGCGTRWKRCG